MGAWGNGPPRRLSMARALTALIVVESALLLAALAVLFVGPASLGGAPAGFEGVSGFSTVAPTAPSMSGLGRGEPGTAKVPAPGPTPAPVPASGLPVGAAGAPAVAPTGSPAAQPSGTPAVSGQAVPTESASPSPPPVTAAPSDVPAPSLEATPAT